MPVKYNIRRLGVLSLKTDVMNTYENLCESKRR